MLALSLRRPPRPLSLHTYTSSPAASLAPSRTTHLLALDASLRLNLPGPGPPPVSSSAARIPSLARRLPVLAGRPLVLIMRPSTLLALALPTLILAKPDGSLQALLERVSTSNTKAAIAQQAKRSVVDAEDETLRRRAPAGGAEDSEHAADKKRWVWGASIIQDDSPTAGLPPVGVNANLLTGSGLTSLPVSSALTDISSTSKTRY